MRPLRAVGLGSVAVAGAAAGAGALVHRWVAAGQPDDIGPTAATLDDVFGTFLLGIVPALFVASVATGLAAGSPPVAFGAALGGAVLLAAGGAMFGVADWPAAVGLVATAVILGAVATSVAALLLMLGGGLR
jgi:hypothetical protein